MFHSTLPSLIRLRQVHSSFKPLKQDKIGRDVLKKKKGAEKAWLIL